MKELRLIIENFGEKYEKKEEGDNLFIEGIFGMANYVNENKRVYPLEKMQEAVERYNKDFFEKDRAAGELGHPETAIINPDRICLKLNKPLELRENGEVVGKAKILKNVPVGAIAYSLLKEGIKLGISTRGLGDVVEDKFNNELVNKVTDYVLIAPDLVMEPSTGKTVSVVNESVRYIYEEGKVEEILKQGVTPEKVGKMDLIDVINLLDFLIKGGK